MTIEKLSELGDNELRIKSAKLCGWKPKTRAMYAGVKNVKGWERDGEFVSLWILLPKYECDLNVMHSAEDRMRGAERCVYLQILGRVVGEAEEKVFATARQRCIAFIATMQKQ